MGFPIGQRLTIMLDSLASQIHLPLHPWHRHYKCVPPYKLIYIGLGIETSTLLTPFSNLPLKFSRITSTHVAIDCQSEHLGMKEEEDEGLG